MDPDSKILWIRIRIEEKCWIRIRVRIESIRIHNPDLFIKNFYRGIMKVSGFGAIYLPSTMNNCIPYHIAVALVPPVPFRPMFDMKYFHYEHLGVAL
jgi:hypothetical protein